MGLNAMRGMLIATIILGCGTSSRSEPPVPRAPIAEPEAHEATEPDEDDPPAALWVDVAVGRHVSCAARDDGRVSCWGTNADGRAGLGDVAYSAVPLPVEGIDDVARLTAGDAHVCALRTEGRVSCWGRNQYEQVGDGTTENRAHPVNLPLPAVVELDAGNDHTCARTDDGEVWCWGRGMMLGDGTSEQRATPVRVLGVDDAIAITAGNMTSCAWNARGEAKCWGFNTAGIFERRPGPEATPRAVLREDPVEAITFGRDHVCFTRKTDHVTFCAGDAEDGALGNQHVPDDAHCEREGDEVVCTHRDPPPPPEPEDPRVPRPCCFEPVVPPLQVHRYPRRTRWVHSAIRGETARASDHRTCFLDAERAVTCFGQRYYGRDWGHRRLEPIAGTAGTTRFDVHDGHACAVVSGSVWCWGDGRSGALGDGALDNRVEARPISD